MGSVAYARLHTDAVNQHSVQNINVIECIVYMFRAMNL